MSIENLTLPTPIKNFIKIFDISWKNINKDGYLYFYNTDIVKHKSTIKIRNIEMDFW